MRAIVFDLDGTLVDTAPTILNSLERACQQEGVIVPKQDLTASLIGPPIVQIVQNLFPKLVSDKAEAIALSFRKIYDSSSHEECMLYDGVLPLLTELKRKRVVLFVATNKPIKPTKTVFDKFGLGALFQEIFTIDYFPDQKINKTKMIALIKEKYAPDKIVMVGDCISDIQAAHDNKIPGIAVNWGYEKDKEKLAQIADETAKTVQALKEYLYD